MTGAREGSGRLLQLRDRSTPVLVGALGGSRNFEKMSHHLRALGVGPLLLIGRGPAASKRVSKRDVAGAEVVAFVP